MKYLVLMLKIFVTAFGLSEPKPGQENKLAFFLLGTLLMLGLLLTTAVWLILHLSR